jgi:type I restriction enzyme R subunit
LTTGVDVPTCKNIVIFKVVNSITEFKQIIGRGTRVRDDYGKLYFDILDYTGSATRLFADPDFDGQPALLTEEEMDNTGQSVEGSLEVVQGEEPLPQEEREPVATVLSDDSEGAPRKYYIDDGEVQIVADMVYELDSAGKRLRVVKYVDYASTTQERKAILQTLEERGISFEYLAEVTKQYDCDPFDLLCHVAFNAPLRTRRERADIVRKYERGLFEKYGKVAKEVLDAVLDKYVEFGYTQLDDMDILKVPPISKYGNVVEIAEAFGGIPELKNALSELQNLVYAR